MLQYKNNIQNKESNVQVYVGIKMN